MKKGEFILCAAINFNDTIVCGRRHGDCYVIIKNLLEKYITPSDMPEREDQGFITSENRYVSRKEAFKIAFAQKQIIHNMFEEHEDIELTSEDLY